MSAVRASVSLLVLPALCLAACFSVTRPTPESPTPGCNGNVESIRTESLPDGVVGQPYSYRFEHNCSGNFVLVGTSWQVSGDLPPGMTLGGPGLTNLDRLSGTPTVSGSFSFGVSLATSVSINGSTIVDSKTFALVVRPAP